MIYRYPDDAVSGDAIFWGYRLALDSILLSGIPLAVEI